jgi:hypothetical protein
VLEKYRLRSISTTVEGYVSCCVIRSSSLLLVLTRRADEIHKTIPYYASKKFYPIHNENSTIGKNYHHQGNNGSIYPQKIPDRNQITVHYNNGISLLVKEGHRKYEEKRDKMDKKEK